MTIGDRIKKTREKLKISQTELANLSNTTKQNIYKYENGIITNIPSDKIETIARILHVSPAYLMGWEEISANNDIDIRRIERARNNMPQKEKDRMMDIIQDAFSKYFSDDFVDEDIDE